MGKIRTLMRLLENDKTEMSRAALIINELSRLVAYFICDDPDCSGELPLSEEDLYYWQEIPKAKWPKCNKCSGPVHLEIIE